MRRLKVLVADDHELMLEAIRIALREAARSRLRPSALRAEAEAAAADPDDVAEMRRIARELEAISAAWSEPE